MGFSSDFSEVDIVGVRYTPVKFGVEMSPE